MSKAIHRQWKFDAGILSLCVNRNGTHVAATLGDGSMRLFAATDETEHPKNLKVHDGISLSLQPDADAHAFLSGGDDGKLFIIDPVLGETTLLAEHIGAVAVARSAEQSRPKNPQWIDHVASSADGKFRAYNTGKKIHVLDDEGKPKFVEPLSAPSNPGGMAFSPNGKRLAVSHYNGVSLWWMNSKETQPTFLEWKGSHLETIWSPDGKILLTSLQESALHGWVVADPAKEMRMQGYAAKVRSFGFTVKSRFLATSGADQIICWPFTGGGPWGKQPLTLGGRDYSAPSGATVTAPGIPLVTQVAPHPKDEMVAAGYSDGMLVLAPLDGRMEIMINPPTADSKATITGLVWNKEGDMLFAATESGQVFLFTIDSVRKAVVQTR